MHKFILMLTMLTGCPATLKVEQSADSNKNIEELIPTEFGIFHPPQPISNPILSIVNCSVKGKIF